MGDEIKDDEYTMGEFEEMDMSPLHDQIFMVAISTGDRNKGKYIQETLCGPFNYYEMVETVGAIYADQQLHAKAMVPSKRFGTAPKVLDEKTIDFIEARYQDIIADGLLGGEIMKVEEYTCTATFIQEEETDDNQPN